MKRTGKSIAAAALALVLGLGTLTGCTPSANSTVLTVGQEKATFAEVNFYARYFQAEYESYSAAMGSTPEAMWSNYVEEDVTMEQMVKDSVRDGLEEMLVLDLNKDEYGVKLTEEDETKISETVAAYMAANDAEVLEVMTADEASVTRILELMTVSQRVKNAIRTEADTVVSDEEALQKRMSYVAISGATTYNAETGSDDATTDMLTDMMTSMNEATALDMADALSEAKDAEGFATLAEDLGFTANEVTYGADSESPCAALCAAAWELKEGEVTEAILDEESGTYYVAFQMSEKDDEATLAQKDVIVSQRQEELIQTRIDEMKAATSINWKESAWKSISFAKQGCFAVSAEAEATEAAEEVPAQTLSADSSLTVADGDKVNISFEGTIDGTAFDGGTSAGSDVVIGSGQLIDDFEQQLIGYHPGDEVEVNVTFPENYQATDLAGKDAVFHVTINGIYQ